MSQPTQQEREAFIQTVRENSGQVREHIARLKRANSGLQLTSIFTSGAGTFVTGLTAAGGPVVGEGVEGWRLACVAGAALGLVTTVCTSLVQQLKTGDRLSQAQLCAARLKLLEVDALGGRGDWNAANREYAELVKAYPDLLA